MCAEPWDETRYSYAPLYAPQDPNQHGGSVYGESLWLTGATSETLTAAMGDDSPCCGRDNHDGGGGCGKCFLVRNPSALRSNLTAVVMKKSYCPPTNPLCGIGSMHVDLAVPGFDYAPESLAPICGSADRAETYLTTAQATACGDWWASASDTATGCDCSALPSDTPARAVLHAGCERFAAWGWTRGDPSLEYQMVPCPPAFEAYVAGSFGADGILAAAVLHPSSPPSSPPPPPSTPPPPALPEGVPRWPPSPSPPLPPAMPPNDTASASSSVSAAAIGGIVVGVAAAVSLALVARQYLRGGRVPSRALVPSSLEGKHTVTRVGRATEIALEPTLKGEDGEGERAGV